MAVIVFLIRTWICKEERQIMVKYIFYTFVTFPIWLALCVASLFIPDIFQMVDAMPGDYMASIRGKLIIRTRNRISLIVLQYISASLTSSYVLNLASLAVCYIFEIISTLIVCCVRTLSGQYGLWLSDQTSSSRQMSPKMQVLQIYWQNNA